jgi:hypothetical protein
MVRPSASDEMSLKSFCHEMSMSTRISEMQDKSADDPLSTNSSEINLDKETEKFAILITIDFDKIFYCQNTLEQEI